MQNQLLRAIGALVILVAVSKSVHAEIPVNIKADVDQHTVVLPYMAVGGAPEGWHFLTILSLENSHRNANSGTIEFFTGDGRPMHVQLNDSTGLAARSEWRVSGKDSTLLVVSHPGGSFEDGWLRVRLIGKEPIKVIVLVQCYNGEQLFAEAGTVGDPSEAGDGRYARTSSSSLSPLGPWRASGGGSIRQINFSGPMGVRQIALPGPTRENRSVSSVPPAPANQLHPTSGCNRLQNTKAPLSSSAKVHSGVTQTGYASWYEKRENGKISASGVRFNQLALTAAHRTLPFGTKVKVTNLRNGCWVNVRIADRGPYVPGRIVDLSAAAARRIGIMRDGVSPVRLETISA